MADEVRYEQRGRVAHAHNAEVSGHSLAGLDARGMRDSM